MELYEGRIASLERFVAMSVIFHELGTRVQRFFHLFSLGTMGYRTDRTHSMCRIATTASPVSGADVRERMEILQVTRVIVQSVRIIIKTWLEYRGRLARRLLEQDSRGMLMNITETEIVRGRFGGSNSALFTQDSSSSILTIASRRKKKDALNSVVEDEIDALIEDDKDS
jgi:hypothetical protein